MVDQEFVQKNIGYEFENSDLLQQAFIRRSYSEEHGGQNNEVLEFIGDKVLDLAVIRIMMDQFGVITSDKEYAELKLRNPKWFRTRRPEGAFTDIKRDLVEKKSLAKAMRSLGFHEMLIMGEGDVKNNVQEQDSVQEDLFEAILGAVAVDCGYDMDTIDTVVRSMINFNTYFDNDEPDQDYVGQLQEWSQRNLDTIPDYDFRETDNGYLCEARLTINGFTYILAGEGSSMSEARTEAAMYLWSHLEDEGIIKSPYEEAVGEPVLEESMRQLNELIQKKLIDQPNFEFKEDHDEDGSFWECRIVSEEDDDPEWYCGDTKKEAQREAAFNFLLDLMGYEAESN